MRAGAAARASWPPLSSERCLRTALSWLIVAPAARRSLVTACLSPSVTGGAGAGVSAEPPPEMRTSTWSSDDMPCTVRRISSRRGSSALVRNGMTGLEESDPPRLSQVAVLDDDHPVGDTVAEHLFDGGGHRAGCLPGSDNDKPPVCGGGHAPEGLVEREGERRRRPGQRRRCPGPRREVSMSEFLQPPARLDQQSSVLGKQKRIFVRPSSP